MKETQDWRSDLTSNLYFQSQPVCAVDRAVRDVMKRRECVCVYRGCCILLNHVRLSCLMSRRHALGARAEFIAAELFCRADYSRVIGAVNIISPHFLLTNPPDLRMEERKKRKRKKERKK